LDAATDAQLLQRFLGDRDEAAFAALVRRHAAMVWGVCRRVLGNDQNAEDAFQATFIVLVRKAASIQPQSLLGNWLFGVAHQVAVKARAMNAKRMSREKQLSAPIATAAAKQNAWQELQPLLDQELSLLPEKYRAVLVLCDLEGRTQKEAAAHLRVPEGTVAGWRARARVTLAKRLARRGLVLSSGSMAALLSNAAASASAPTSVVASTIKSASLLAAGGAIARNVAALAEGVIQAMFLKNLKSVLGILLVVLGLSLGAASQSGLFAHGDGQALGVANKEGEAQAPTTRTVGAANSPETQKKEPAQKDTQENGKAGNAMNLGFIKIEARGDLVRKGADYFLVVKQNKFPTTEWLVRSNVDKSAINKILLSHKDCAVVLTGNLSWLPKGRQVNSDDDYALGIVISAEAQLRRGNVFDTTSPYVKFEAQGDPWVIDNSFYVRVQLQEKPAKKVTVFGQIRNMGQLMTVFPKLNQATVAGYVTWEPKPSDEYAFRLPFIDIDKLDRPPAEAPGSKGSADKKSPEKKTAAEIEKLVKDLGNADAATREAASKELLKVGEAALPFLAKAMKSDDVPETRRRAEALHRMICTPSKKTGAEIPRDQGK
jgi:RNA polymerase sigma factor (sigma-70 family)